MKNLQCSLKDLLAKNPSIATLLKQYHINATQHGEDSLFTVLQGMPAEAEIIEDTVNLLMRQPASDSRWILNPVSDLIAYIENYYHAAHRKQLPELLDLAKKVSKENAQNPQYPAELVARIEDLHKDLIAHMATEEQRIFPQISTHKAQHIYCQVGQLLHNHDYHHRELEHIEALTHSFHAPAAASEDWVALYQKLAEFNTALREHIRLENELVFAQAS